MSSLNQIKSQVIKLINNANNTTGKSDTNLTNAQDTLIDGYGEGNDKAIIEGTLVNFKNDNVSSIKKYCFYNDQTINSVESSSVTSIGSYAFYNCDSLVDINMPNLELIKDNAFEECDALTELNLPSVKNINDYAFENCDQLTKVVAPNLETCGTQAFYYSRKLEEIDMPKLKTVSGMMTFAATAIKHLYLPSLTTADHGSFYFCSSLESIDLPLLTTCDLQTFDDCEKLKYINLPVIKTITRDMFAYANIEDINGTDVHMPLVNTVGLFSFSRCTNLKTVYFPELTSVSQGAFQYCSALHRCEFDKPVSFGYGAFSPCANLTTFILNNKTLSTLSETNAFSETPIANGTGYIYVPKDVIESYKTNTKWSTYADSFRAIEDWPDVVKGKEVIRHFVMDTTTSQNNTFDVNYVDNTDGYSLKLDYQYYSQEEEIDSGRLAVVKIKTNDKTIIEEVVVLENG